MTTRLAAVVLSASLILVGCGGSASTAPSPAGSVGASASAKTSQGVPSLPPLARPIPVKIAIIGGVMGEAGMVIAMERGYFKDLGLDVEFVPIRSGPQQIPALAAGQVDFADPAPDPGLFNAIARGIELKIVAAHNSVQPGNKQSAVMVRQDHVDSGRYKGLSDLKGMTIGAGPVLGTAAQFFVEKALTKGGVAAKDVNFTIINYADLPAAFTGKSLDGAWAIEPFKTAGEDAKIMKVAAYADELAIGAITQLFLVNPTFAKNQPEATRRVALAHLLGQRDYYHAVQKKTMNPEPIVAALVKSGTVKDAETLNRLGLLTVDPNDDVDLNGLNEYVAYFNKSGTLTEKVDVAQIYDSSYTKWALEQVGRI